jgi:putative transposase
MAHKGIWAYCLMSSHIHVLAVPQAPESLAFGIGLVNQNYTRYINRKYLRSGRVWQNRFFSCIVRSYKPESFLVYTLSKGSLLHAR